MSHDRGNHPFIVAKSMQHRDREIDYWAPILIAARRRVWLAVIRDEQDYVLNPGNARNAVLYLEKFSDLRCRKRRNNRTLVPKSNFGPGNLGQAFRRDRPEQHLTCRRRGSEQECTQR